MSTTAPIDIRTEAFPDFMADYPYASEVDKLEDLPVHLFIADDSGTPFQARVLGFGSSYLKTHKDHAPGTFPGKGMRCSGCRWTDTAIMWAQPLDHKAVQALEAGHNNDPYGSDVPDDWEAPAAQQRWQYVFVSLGKSMIPGETQRNTVIWTEDAEDVLRKLFVPTKKDFRRDTGEMAIPPHNASAFRDAACIDEAIADLLARYGAVIPEGTRAGLEADPLAGL